MWITRWKDTIWHPAAREGIWRRRAGGYLISTQIRDAKGKRRMVQRRLPEASLEEAQRELDALRLERRAVLNGRVRSTQLFSSFAASAFRKKVQARDIRSAKGVEKWKTALEQHLIPELGHLACNELKHAHVAQWRADLAIRIAAPEKARNEKGRLVRNPAHLSPRTVNGIFSILRVLTKRAVAELDLERDPCLGLANFSTLEHPTYTDEAPNALTEEQARSFAAKMRELYPQHYAMTVLGLATGLRPSSLRPLRRSGPEADVDWAQGILRVRRSHSMGAEVMSGTKTGRRQTIHLPAELVGILREHVALLQARPKQKASELLFPSFRGSFRARSVLDKPFVAVSLAIGLAHPVTPRAMRRTFNDLARLAEVDSVVKRSISGHATEQMAEHYSTAQVEEQRAGIAKVVRLIDRRRTG